MRGMIKRRIRKSVVFVVFRRSFEMNFGHLRKTSSGRLPSSSLASGPSGFSQAGGCGVIGVSCFSGNPARASPFESLTFRQRAIRGRGMTNDGSEDPSFVLPPPRSPEMNPSLKTSDGAEYDAVRRRSVAHQNVGPTPFGSCPLRPENSNECCGVLATLRCPSLKGKNRMPENRI